MKRILGVLVLLIGAVGFSEPAEAFSSFFGTDLSGSTTNSDGQHALWAAAVGGGIVTDDLSTLVIMMNEGTTTPGNTFTAAGSTSLSAANFSVDVIFDENLEVFCPSFNCSSSTGFDWTFAAPAFAFGFFGHENDSGTITLLFVDGTQQNFNFGSAGMNGDNLFLGVANLSVALSGVMVRSTDPGADGISNWDNFSFAPVPEPTGLLLFSVGMLVVGWTLRRHTA